MRNLDLKNVYEWPIPMQGILFAIIFVLVLYFGYLVDISSLRAELAAAKAHEEDLKSQVLQGVRKEAAISKDISRFPVLKQQLAQWQKKLIKHDDLPELLNDILKIGSNNHIYFNLLDPEDTEKYGIYIKAPIRAKVVGSYHELGQFISQVANLPWLIVVGDFVVTLNSKNTSSGNASVDSSGNVLSGDFTFNVYHLPEPSDEAKA